MASQGEDEEPRGALKPLSSPGKRARAADYGFFDFSLIPDKMDSGRSRNGGASPGGRK